MKKLCIFLIMLFCVPAIAQESVVKESYSSVICSPNKKMCTVGKHSLSSKVMPLYVTDGIVCTHNKKTCTNGFTYMRSTIPIEIKAAHVLCTKNGKTCAVGQHRLSSNTKDPLYVSDGVVCTSNRKLCTNGFRYMSSNEPLY